MEDGRVVILDLIRRFLEEEVVVEETGSAGLYAYFKHFCVAILGVG
jgi:hypothetical protein